MKKAVIYARLSQEDEKNGVSESIQNQISFLNRYALQNNIEIVEIYCDDGYSGLHFKRPAFQKMLKDIERGIFDCILLKDLSRLGRDYIAVGYFLEQYFPQKEIQIIAVNDNINTENATDYMPFQALLNDFYARDISKKIKCTLDTKIKNGQFIGAFAPYGYQKDSKNKNHLVIEKESAKIVQNIFTWYLQGESMSCIAQKLNNFAIPSPAIHKMIATNYQNSNIKYGLWTQQTIKNILSNETYAGNVTQGKTKKLNYKNNKIKKIPRQYWVVKQNTHEAIIPYDTFETAQFLLNQKSRGQKGNQKSFHLLGGLLYCGDCGSPMTFRRNKKKEFILLCSNYTKQGSCSRHQFFENQCNDIIKKELLSLSQNRNIIEIQNPPNSNYNQKRLLQINAAQKKLYEDRTNGILEEKEFLNIMEQFRKEKKLIQSQCQMHCQKISLDTLFYQKWVLCQLIQKILFFEKQHSIQMHIYWQFSAP